MNPVFLSYSSTNSFGQRILNSPSLLKRGQGRVMFHETDPREAALATKFLKLFARLIIEPSVTEQPTNGKCLISRSPVTTGCATMITFKFTEKVEEFIKNNSLNGVYIPK